jgi:stage IV sporulation protein B
VAEAASGTVYLGGTPIGVIAKSDGMTVMEITDVITEKGAVRPSEAAGLRKGDMILRINSYKISGAEDISKALEKGGIALILIRRNGENLTLSVMPVKDLMTNTYKLGLQVKNEIAGVGTLTYVRADNKRFGGLGHNIYDGEFKNKDAYKYGTTFECTIIGVVKGEPGKAGELRGSFNRGGNPTGKIDKNTFAGIFGPAEEILYDGRPLIGVGNRDAVNPGKAYIYTSLKGSVPEKFEIEIVKAAKQNVPEDRSLVIRITDDRLLNESGGIVQGMSGSPIIQNGKLIGAVTHVFINDPTRGYGIYIDWMIDN